jgi:hypothetical protein
MQRRGASELKGGREMHRRARRRSTIPETVRIEGPGPSCGDPPPATSPDVMDRIPQEPSRSC